jgi:hypothetical protein
MKNTAILAALGGMLAFGIHGATATCYKSGYEMTTADKNQAWGFAGDACYNNGGIFTVWFDPEQTKAMCPRTEGDIGVFFQVQNLNTNTGFDLGDDNCYLRLSNLIDGCSRGGEDIIAGWHFR